MAARYKNASTTSITAKFWEFRSPLGDAAEVVVVVVSISLFGARYANAKLCRSSTTMMITLSIAKLVFIFITIIRSKQI